MGVRGLRGARAAAAATGTTIAALWMHLVGGAVMPGGLGVMKAWLLALTVAFVLVGSCLSTARLTAAVGAGQIVFHALFTLSSPGGHRAGHDAHTASAGSAGHEAVAVGTDLASLLWRGVAMSPRMAVSHAVATAVVVALVRHGERALRSSHDALARLALVIAPYLPWLQWRPNTVRCVMRPHAAPDLDRRPHSEWRPTHVRRRGPPSTTSASSTLRAWHLRAAVPPGAHH